MVRNYLLALGGISSFGGPLFVIYLLSPLPDPWRTALAWVITLAWLGGAISITFTLRRNLTTAEMRDEGLHVGKKLILYEMIQAINEHPSRAIFTLELRERRKDLDVSKVGITSEEEFFRQLRARISRPQWAE